MKFLGKRAARITGEAEEIVTLRLVEVLNQNRQSDALARLDERLRSSPVAEAFALRAYFHDACAALWRVGEFVQVEDLILHDAGMDTRSPTHELVRTHAVLRARRRIVDHEPSWALTTPRLSVLRGQWSTEGLGESGGVKTKYADRDDDDLPQFQYGDHESMEGHEFAEIDALLARTSKVDKPPEAPNFARENFGLIYDQDWDERARLSEWRQGLEETSALPPLMAAGLAFDAWETIEPLQHGAWLGPLARPLTCCGIAAGAREDAPSPGGAACRPASREISPLPTV